MRNLFFIVTVVCISITSLVFAGPKKFYGADYIYETNGVAVFWAVLKGPSIESNLVYINIVPLKPDTVKYQRYSVVAANVFSGEQKTRIDFEKLKPENIIKEKYSEFLSKSETSLLFYVKTDTKKNPQMVIYYKGVPDAAPEFKEEGQIKAFFEHSMNKLAATSK